MSGSRGRRTTSEGNSREEVGDHTFGLRLVGVSRGGGRCGTGYNQDDDEEEEKETVRPWWGQIW